MCLFKPHYPVRALFSILIPLRHSTIASLQSLIRDLECQRPLVDHCEQMSTETSKQRAVSLFESNQNLFITSGNSYGDGNPFFYVSSSLSGRNARTLLAHYRKMPNVTGWLHGYIQFVYYKHILMHLIYFYNLINSCSYYFVYTYLNYHCIFIIFVIIICLLVRTIFFLQRCPMKTHVYFQYAFALLRLCNSINTYFILKANYANTLWIGIVYYKLINQYILIKKDKWTFENFNEVFNYQAVCIKETWGLY